VRPTRRARRNSILHWPSEVRAGPSTLTTVLILAFRWRSLHV
jgi:hypothetical protein